MRKVELGSQSVFSGKALFDGFNVGQSVFKDRYDFDLESEVVDDLIEKGVEPNSLEDLRVREFERRSEILLIEVRKVLKSVRSLNRIEIAIVESRHEDRNVAETKKMGMLRSEADSVELHTIQAAKMMRGVERSPKGDGFPGVTTAASCAREIFKLSNSNNPFVDWTLLDIEKTLADSNQKLDDALQALNAKLAQFVSMGVSVHVMGNSSPAKFTVEFGSPYGFMLVQNLLKFDQYVRLVMTFNFKGLMSNQERNLAIESVRSPMRSMYWKLLNANRMLRHDSIRALSRDVLADNFDLVLVLCRSLGLIDREVLLGSHRPAFGLGYDAGNLNFDALGAMHDRLSRELGYVVVH